MTALEFDPVSAGELEYGWWRAHNDKNRELMSKLLVQLHLELYKMEPEIAKEALGHFVEAVKYHDLRDWDNAASEAANYYAKIKSTTGLEFDPKEAGKLEIAWWRLHDELEHNPDKSKLVTAFSDLYSVIYKTEPVKLKTAAESKARATFEHDLAEDPKTPEAERELHWAKTREALVSFYQELKSVV